MSTDPNSQPPRSVVLIGFMGSGKTTVGRKLHDQLGYPLIDTDQLIEERSGLKIREIFAQKGEEAFRDLETELLAELADQPPSSRIISTGGGIVVRPENRKLLRGMGFVVWLKASAETIGARTARNQSRPLLQTDDPKAAIGKLMALREPMYEDASHLSLDTAGLELDEVCAGILDCASYHFTQGDN